MTPSTANPSSDATTINVPPDLPLIELIREFDAHVDRVFRAYVDSGPFV